MRHKLLIVPFLAVILTANVVVLLGVSVAVRQMLPSLNTRGGWVKYDGNPVLGGDLGTVFDVSVLKEDDVFRMWISWRPESSVALVESDDGIHWSEPTIVLVPALLFEPH